MTFLGCFLFVIVENSTICHCFESAGIIWDAPGHVPGSLRFGASTYRCRPSPNVGPRKAPETRKNRFRIISLIIYNGGWIVLFTDQIGNLMMLPSIDLLIPELKA